MLTGQYLDTIKRFEGFETRAKWDYAQFTNGYGTKAAFPGEQISREEADRRFKQEIAQAAVLVDRFAPSLDAGTRAALTSLTFNAGTKWMGAGLGAAIKSGNLEEGRNIFLQYNKAGGEVLLGLARRRLEEATWFGNAHVANVADETPTGATIGAWKTQAFAATSIETPPETIIGTVTAHAYTPAYDGETRISAGPANTSITSVEAMPSEAQALIEQVILEQWRLMALDLKADPTKEDQNKA